MTPLSTTSHGSSPLAVLFSPEFAARTPTDRFSSSAKLRPAMPSPASRPLLSLTLTLVLLAMFALLFTAVAIDRATPEELARVFHLPAGKE